MGVYRLSGRVPKLGHTLITTGMDNDLTRKKQYDSVSVEQSKGGKQSAEGPTTRLNFEPHLAAPLPHDRMSPKWPC